LNDRHYQAPSESIRFYSTMRTYFFSVVSIVDPNAGKDGWGQNRAISRITGSVYRFGSDGQYGAYIINPHGVVVIDGHYCASGTMAWLKEEIKSRHQQDVAYVILSHDHPDHICKTELFEDTAVVIGHQNIRRHILREKRESAVPDIVFDEKNGPLPWRFKDKSYFSWSYSQR
jgi:glyoxylase-like metal-dependent hydrolase (beta-lactamase superfamily II)